MNKVLLSVALALGLCGSGCFSQSTDKNDIRFVDVDRILTQSKTARVRDSHIEAVNQSLKADLEKLMQAMARAPEAERRRADQMGISVMDRVRNAIVMPSGLTPSIDQFPLSIKCPMK